MNRRNKFKSKIGIRSLVLLVSAVWMCAGAAVAADSAPLSATLIRGSSVYSPTQFYVAYRDRLGQPVDPESARRVMGDIESMYARDGYLRPRIQVWDDLLAEGILRVDVHEVWLVDAVVKGDAGPYAEKVAAVTRTLMTELPLRSKSIPEALQSLRNLPGLEVKAGVTEQPGVDGGLILNLTAGYRPVNVALEWSNRGTGEVGPQFLSAQVTENNLLGGGERLGAFVTAAVRTSEYHAVGGFLELPLGRRGTLLSLSGFHSNSQPTLDGAQYDLFHPQDSVSLNLSRWFSKRERFEFAAGIGAEYTNARIDFDGVELESDRLRMAQMNLRMQGAAGRTGAYAVSMQWRHGLNGFNAGVGFSDGSTLDPVFDIGTVNVGFTAPVGRNLRWRMELSGQSSSRMLPYVEQFKVGGQQLGRGLATAMMAGDSGAGAKLELSYRIRGVPGWLGAPAVFGYSDYGLVWQRGVGGSQHIGTAGVGLQTQLPWGRLAAEVGRPVSFSGARPAGTSIFGEAQVRF